MKCDIKNCPMFESQRNNERPCVVFGAPDECPLWKEFHNKDKKLAKIEGWIETGISLIEVDNTESIENEN